MEFVTIRLTQLNAAGELTSYDNSMLIASNLRSPLLCFVT